ncbi:hypothetical protein LOZ53_005173 [Ophidiomyces ophidiicola]|uniref:Uncharacterized protein n=1 Tax=Ophidiomyces ophidiicola TaxID=1387563 RepID=A0ACB8V0P0_9EURO|nr:uncharacterized protein LOZ57_001795 [Ophidiomyces ophidiicola]KAI1917709.1 hypothetical protein LOZ61_000328 [Ophidiomyces ophidiicola]KAI1919389.1 hypothetical protein LOZ64_002312 [Ophidiomyces ophidiicola]KAI1928363.1 hypothetical protein LOZ60_002460 [Ophidiomyces ophidiicola]KAI1951240.1 hypothetical protein LOZ57_001795 [Ophidiomyces ophidiicola]KAI1953617.1 hypothetical protein LOZ62_000977 [Ophidiomyces ophidiicola]
MASVQGEGGHLRPSKGLSRWYIDMQILTATSSTLPLLATLRPEDQNTVNKYYHLADRHMSLASYLLKYLFIHRSCRIPWNTISLSRTPAPHKRPCYIPLAQDDGYQNRPPIPKVEFNVSHQASLVAIAGCIMPDQTNQNISFSPSPTGSPSGLQVGIDITCTDERDRRGSDSYPKSEADLYSFIDIYAEVFSAREIEIMKSMPSQPYGLEESIKYRLRLFYTYWALKEAYIKMTGEALLAPWLRQLEFLGVIPPEPSFNGETSTWGPPETRMQVFLHGKKVENVRIEVLAFGKTYLIATATRGSIQPNYNSESLGPVTWCDFQNVDIDTDISPCASGTCHC